MAHQSVECNDSAQPARIEGQPEQRDSSFAFVQRESGRERLRAVSGIDLDAGERETTYRHLRAGARRTTVRPAVEIMDDTDRVRPRPRNSLARPSLDETYRARYESAHTPRVGEHVTPHLPALNLGPPNRAGKNQRA